MKWLTTIHESNNWRIQELSEVIAAQNCHYHLGTRPLSLISCWCCYWGTVRQSILSFLRGLSQLIPPNDTRSAIFRSDLSWTLGNVSTKCEPQWINVQRVRTSYTPMRETPPYPRTSSFFQCYLIHCELFASVASASDFGSGFTSHTYPLWISTDRKFFFQVFSHVYGAVASFFLSFS